MPSLKRIDLSTVDGRILFAEVMSDPLKHRQNEELEWHDIRKIARDFGFDLSISTHYSGVVMRSCGWESDQEKKQKGHRSPTRYRYVPTLHLQEAMS